MVSQMRLLLVSAVATMLLSPSVRADELRLLRNFEKHSFETRLIEQMAGHVSMSGAGFNKCG